MRSLRLSNRASHELRRIESYTRETFGIAQADQYLLDIQNNFEMLLSHPEIGRAADDVREGYRKISSGSHVIYYTIGDAHIDVIAVLHSQMDAGHHLGE